MTGDGGWEVYDRGGSGAPEAPVPAPAPRSGGTGRLASAFAGLVAGAVLGAGVVLAVHDDDPVPSVLDADRDAEPRPVADPVEPVEPPELPQPPAEPVEPEPVDVLTVRGFRALVEAVRERTGSTTVFEVGLHGTHASVTVPADKRSQREVQLSWDGEFDEMTRGTSNTGRIDLAAVDPALLPRIQRQVRRLVDDPTGVHVWIEGPSRVFDDDGTRITASASNEYSESAYVDYRIDGTVVRRSGA